MGNWLTPIIYTLGLTLYYLQSENNIMLHPVSYNSFQNKDLVEDVVCSLSYKSVPVI